MAGYLSEKGLRVLSNGFDIIPIKPGDKAPSIKGWERVRTTERQLNGWLSNGRADHGLGIPTRFTPFADFDIHDRPCLQHLIDWTETNIGFAPLRIGNAPKCGMVFRLKGITPFRKISSRIYNDAEGRKSQVEILAEGQQFVAFAIHPDTGKPYHWLRGDSPESWTAKQLPEIGEDDARALVAEFERYAETQNWQLRKSPGSLATPAEDKPDWIDDDELEPDNSEPLGLNEDRIKQYLMAIPNDERFDAREDWLKIGFAISHETGKSTFGRDIWEEWSLQHPSHDQTLFDKAWNSFEKRDKRFRGITFRFIVKLSKELDERPTISIEAGELPRIVTEAEDALIGGAAPIYTRAQHLVRPIVETVDAAAGRKTKTARLIAMTEAGLTDWFARTAKWDRFDARAKKRVFTDPSPKAAAILMSRDGEWRMPPLAGVITTQTMREDGSLLTAEGYDPQTRLLLMQPPAMPTIPDRPSQRDAERALTLLDELLTEFPFTDDASRSVALSALMTPILRGGLPVAPLHLARAPTPGSGKSYLMDIASAIATGEVCPVISAASGEETEKRLSACLLAGQPIVSIDNLNGDLDGDFLCQAVERRRPQIRILGKSERVTIESRTSIFATGNNLIVRGDMVRRTLVCSLDPEVERPELRKFHTDPVKLIVSDRGAYVAAVLTIARAYLAAGEPGLARPLASFDAWSRFVRSALVWLGRADPASTIEISRSEDPVLNTLRQFVGAWREEIGVGRGNNKTASEIIKLANEPGFDDREATGLQAALATFGGSAYRLGLWLRRNRGRVIDGLRISGEPDLKSKIVKWHVETIFSGDL